MRRLDLSFAMTSPLRLAIIGGGNIGSAFALKLVSVGHHDVTVIARPGSKRLQQLQELNGIVSVSGQRAAVTVSDELDTSIAYDVVIVTTHAHQVEPLLPVLQASATKAILFMFNIYDPDRLARMFGARAVFGMPFIQVDLTPEGLVDANYNFKSAIGDVRWVEVFKAADIMVYYEPKMLLWLRSHVPVGVGVITVCVPASRRGAGATWGEAMTVARAAHASWTLTKSLGYSIYGTDKAVFASLPVAALAALLWVFSRTSLRNRFATAKGEAFALVDGTVEAARQANMTSLVPVLEAVKTL
ncbi:hypothetical protein BKA62DRAFT_709793 [Auriculariales sp. MPI-PUGE-AT-0066]|nr:hypothetical protein BKA62DRAFT_709793 [Auriculariales sp. MPI-PUGE-AT-0066]